ncbi:MAG: hypothetical protein ACE366_06075 [Bradymonadia bacterium]
MKTAELFPPDAPDAFDPSALDRLSPLLSGALRASRHRVEWPERWPSAGALWVLPAGTSPLDALAMASALRRAGRPWPRLVLDERWLRWPALNPHLGALGVLPASHYVIRRRLMAGHAVLAQLGEGEGLVQVAFKCDVPIVPVRRSLRRGPGPLVTGVTHRVGAGIPMTMGRKETAREAVSRLDGVLRAAFEA